MALRAGIDNCMGERLGLVYLKDLTPLFLSAANLHPTFPSTGLFGILMFNSSTSRIGITLVVR
jgi:hypothetical protein